MSLSARLLLLALTAFFAESRFLMMLAATEEVVGDWRNVVESWKRTWEVEWGGGGGEGGRAAFFSAWRGGGGGGSEEEVREFWSLSLARALLLSIRSPNSPLPS